MPSFGFRGKDKSLVTQQADENEIRPLTDTDRPSMFQNFFKNHPFRNEDDPSERKNRLPVPFNYIPGPFHDGAFLSGSYPLPPMSFKEW